MSKKKNNKPYRTEVGEDGKMVKVYLEEEPVKEEQKVVAEAGETTFLTEIKLGMFQEKSQFIAIMISAFGGFICLQDFYLKLYKRAVVKFCIFAVGLALAIVLFNAVQNETAISYNTLFQAIMMLPLLVYFLLWSYDFITLARKSGKHFKVKSK